MIIYHRIKNDTHTCLWCDKSLENVLNDGEGFLFETNIKATLGKDWKLCITARYLKPLQEPDIIQQIYG